ncbi:hypothetical protein [Flavobacterium johnsoniae]|jgi:hypothetical protein|uniref:HTH cro/C1-type domain-containing protein n=2 Tax=Flavobacterium johnsoniae TaxID=986 RepID=A0A1M6PZG2_FLAJO|nr:hypothetical protein [Flavobacterium johnsoniae]ABQ04131.1 hypothetical protein Fjoh_1098 [Flavobacterium johnsoniae UW101]OXG02637.1 hypothetical protein B0A63_02990 [Flavobacterium johnsoniae UW101]WQG78999.1 hypothetical protein SR927_13310 [Flavobacterium johnsoniae UW101]SHG15026.1 hypothetical protein SAMN05444388_101850 [Flavobacterium johnsoniae]SHK13256.1 hypothetical protein SAMN05444146_0514 [Flavobacterium johnsoniae]
MEKDKVPQDTSNLTKNNVKELLYATDENGNYTTTLSTGWEPKTIALSNSIDEINERIADARQQVLDGEVSPIVYFMEINKMDLTILSSYVGFWKWRVKRHFKPSVFASLSDKVLQKYADTFEISIDELKNSITK